MKIELKSPTFILTINDTKIETTFGELNEFKDMLNDNFPKKSRVTLRINNQCVDLTNESAKEFQTLLNTTFPEYSSEIMNVWNTEED